MREIVLDVPVEDALDYSREALATLPHSRFRADGRPHKLSASVFRGPFRAYWSHVDVTVAPDDGRTRVIAASRSWGYIPLDWGSNWEYVTLFTDALALLAHGRTTPDVVT